MLPPTLKTHPHLLTLAAAAVVAVVAAFVVAGTLISCQRAPDGPVTIDGSTQESFERTVEDLRATLSIEDAERFQEIYLDRVMQGHGRGQMDGLTAQDFLATWHAREEISQQIDALQTEVEALSKISAKLITREQLEELQTKLQALEKLYEKRRSLD